MAIIVDPETYNKLEAFELGKDLVKEFLDLNCLKHPSVINDCSLTAQQRRKTSKINIDYGFYVTKTQSVNVNLKKSRTPVKTPGFQWSYTGFKADMTAPGILCHEIGHHLHTILGEHYSRHPKGIVLDFFQFARSQGRVSSYEPNLYESFAETTRLFMLNPSLLEEGRRLRYEFFTKKLNLKPVVDIHWKKVLVNAHEKIIKAAENWIK